MIVAESHLWHLENKIINNNTEKTTAMSFHIRQKRIPIKH
jgi:hypothetical protein